MEYLILIIAFAFTLLLTYFIRIIAIKKRIIDIPNERSSHSIPTPRGGGLSITVCWFIGISVLFYFGEIEKGLFLALLSGIVLAIISVIDDVISLSPKIRLIGQAATAILAVYYLNGLEIPFFTKSIAIKLILNSIIVIGIIWFINLYNFLDGIDAYASLEAIFIAAALSLFTNSLLPLLLIAAIMGFLVWNWPKAKIFMGDVGSTQLGFILIVLGIYYHNAGQFTISQWAILTSVFWFDATFTLLRRWRNKEQLSVAHKKHAYQRFVQAGHSHMTTDIYLLVINLFLLGLTYLTTLVKGIWPISLILVVLFLFKLTKAIDRKVPF